MNANDLIRLIDLIAPPHCAEKWDKCGVQIASVKSEIRTLAVLLDPMPDTIAKALEAGADFILAHHPLTLEPRLPSRLDAYHKALSLAIKADAWLYAAHTSLDTQADGAPAWLADALELTNRKLLDETSRVGTVRVSLRAKDGAPNVAPDAVSGFAAAMRPLAVRLSKPDEAMQAFRVRQDRLTYFLQCLEARLGLRLGQAVVDPEDEQPLGFGLVGDLPQAMRPTDFLATIARLTGRTGFTRTGELPEAVRRVAYCPGSGSSFTARAFAAKADIYLTGEMKYHLALEMEESGCVLDVGHFCLEERMMGVLAGDLKRHLAPFGVQTVFIPGHDPVVPISPAGLTI